MIESFAMVVETSRLGGFARGSDWAHPAANLIHLLGLVLLIGGIGLIDLRLAGLWRSLPLDPLMRALAPVAIGGLVLMAFSGPILFAADATALAVSGNFKWKLALIVLALANAVAIRRLRRGKPGEAAAIERVLAILPLVLWLTVGALGRMIAYN